MTNATQRTNKQKKPYDPQEDKMGTSGNPAKRTTSSAADFKKRTGGLLTLPSGLTVKVQNREGLRAFLESGMIPNSLMGIVNEAVSEGKAPSEAEIGKLIGVDKGQIDQSTIDEMLEMTNKVVMRVVVDPPIHPVPENEDDRDDELLYVDEVDDTDKMFIFQWVTGGTRDIEQFRQEQTSTLGALGGQQSGRGKAKRPTRNR